MAILLKYLAVLPAHKRVGQRERRLATATNDRGELEIDFRRLGIAADDDQLRFHIAPRGDWQPADTCLAKTAIH